jgi:hypothetical protein
MTRPPFIDSRAFSPEDFFHDRRTKRAAGALPPDAERRAKQQFDAIPWWLKVNYTKAAEAPKAPPLASETVREASQQ